MACVDATLEGLGGPIDVVIYTFAPGDPPAGTTSGRWEITVTVDRNFTALEVRQVWDDGDEGFAMTQESTFVWTITMPRLFSSAEGGSLVFRGTQASGDAPTEFQLHMCSVASLLFARWV